MVETREEFADGVPATDGVAAVSLMVGITGGGGVAAGFGERARLMETGVRNDKGSVFLMIVVDVVNAR